MSYGLTGNVKHSNGLLTTHKRRNEARNIKRRQILPGYPIKKIFESREEIDEYMAGDRIVCLLCGRSYKALGCHLQVHGISSDQYKIEYGLPMSVGLDIKELFSKKSKRFKQMIKDGVIHADKKEMEHYRKLGQKNAKHGVRQPFRKKIDAVKLNKHLQKIKPNDNSVFFNDESYRQVFIISKMLDMHPFDVCEENKGFLPSSTLIRDRNRSDKNFKKMYYEIIESLPFRVQAAHQQLGKRFISEVRRLSSLGYSLDAMEEELCVDKQTIVNWRARYKIKTIVTNYCHRGHKYENEKRKCNVCATMNRRKAHNHLPRELARHTEQIKKCKICGIDVVAKRLGRPYCEKCKREAYLQSQKKYKENNLEKRKEMARLNYQKRRDMKC